MILTIYITKFNRNERCFAKFNAHHNYLLWDLLCIYILYNIMYMQLCSLHLAGGAVSLYAIRQLTDEEAMLVVTMLAELASKVPKVCSIESVISVPSPHSLNPFHMHACNSMYIHVY